MPDVCILPRSGACTIRDCDLAASADKNAFLIMIFEFKYAFAKSVRSRLKKSVTFPGGQIFKNCTVWDASHDSFLKETPRSHTVGELKDLTNRCFT